MRILDNTAYDPGLGTGIKRAKQNYHPQKHRSYVQPSYHLVKLRTGQKIDLDLLKTDTYFVFQSAFYELSQPTNRLSTGSE